MSKVRVNLIIEGHVQGVFFRASTRDTALRLGLKGWVKNLSDGRVEVIFEGPLESIHNAIEWCRNGPPGATVRSVDEKWLEHTGEFHSFDIRY